MNDEVQKIRKRLQELHDLHTTGFVDDAQYAESLAVLERRLVDAVMKEAPADAPASPPARPPADSPPQSEQGAFRPPIQRSKRLPWLAALGGVLVAAAVFGWMVLREGSGRGPEPSAAMPSSEKGEQASQTVASAPAVIDAPPASASVAAAGDASISGTVALAPALASRVSASDTVFVYAHAVDGPGVPLAVVRKQVKDLPLAFRLDDSMTMWSTARLSSVQRVIVVARVSHSGDGAARRGDLQGASQPVSAGASGLQIEIDTVIEK